MTLQRLLVPVLLVFAACSSPTQNVTLIENVRGYTLENNELSVFESLAIADGKVLSTSAVSQREVYPKASIIDGNQAVLIPGFTDAHAHVMGLGYAEMEVDLMGTTSIAEALERIKAFADENPQAKWIKGRGWNHTRWKENRFPTSKELDAIIADRPVWLRRVDGHAAWGNSKAFEIAGVTRESRDPVGGKIERDRFGNPQGVMVDKAMDYVEKHMPRRSAEEEVMALEKALFRMRSLGITSVHDAGISSGTFDLYKKFADEGKLTTRIYAMIGGPEKDFDEIYAKIQTMTEAKIESSANPVKAVLPSYKNDVLSVRSVKLYSDGALGSRGAAMLHPYHDDPSNKGLLFHDQKEFERQIEKVASRGYQVNIHAIGDAGNHIILNAFETVKSTLGEQDLRHRIEHAQIVSLTDIPRFKALNIIASMQPIHATSDMNMAEFRVGKQRIKGAYAWRKFLDQGTLIASGSDFPVEPVNPFLGYYAAVTRQDLEGKPVNGWYTEEKMSRLEAFRSFTIDAAYAAHQEHILGTLEPGKYADFILIDVDIFTGATTQLHKTKVLETWVGGKKVFDAKE